LFKTLSKLTYTVSLQVLDKISQIHEMFPFKVKFFGL